MINWIPSVLILLFTSIFFLSDQVDCRQGRVIGGDLAQPGEFKHVVFIYFQDANGLCTGGILSLDLVITAAHCVLDVSSNEFKKGRIRVVGGKNQVFMEDANSGILVNAIMVPNLYNADNVAMRGDIALLRLSEPLSGDIQILNLPNSTWDYLQKQVLKFAGFGRSEVVQYADGSYQTVSARDGTLRKADVQVDPYCTGRRKPIDEYNFCARMINYRNLAWFGVCKGDSGGPLVDENGIVFGIANHGRKGCNEIKQPAVYSNVYFYINDIILALNGWTINPYILANEAGYF